MAHWIFTDEHEMFRKTVQRFVQKEMEPFVEEWEKAESIPKSFIKRLGELGFLGISISEDNGGTGLDRVTEAILLEELTKAGACGPVLLVQFHQLALEMLNRFGNDRLKELYLLPGVQGNKVMSVVLSESSFVTAEQNKEGFILNGPFLVWNGNQADYIIVPAKDTRTQSSTLFFIHPLQEGVTFKRRKKTLGWRSLHYSEIVLNRVHVPFDCLIGEEGSGEVYEKELNKWQQVSNSLVLVSLAEKALQCAIQYSKERIQFGKPLTSFQVLRHKMADMAIVIEKARNIVYRALYLFQRDANSAAFLAATTVANDFAKEMAKKVCDEALQIHGGAGYMMEFPVQRYWRDAKMYSLVNKLHKYDKKTLLGWLTEQRRGLGIESGKETDRVASLG
jgi:acyl-CoA dehydrogenase